MNNERRVYHIIESVTGHAFEELLPDHICVNRHFLADLEAYPALSWVILRFEWLLLGKYAGTNLSEDLYAAYAHDLLNWRDLLSPTGRTYEHLDQTINAITPDWNASMAPLLSTMRLQKPILDPVEWDFTWAAFITEYDRIGNSIPSMKLVDFFSAESRKVMQLAAETPLVRVIHGTERTELTSVLNAFHKWSGDDTRHALSMVDGQPTDLLLGLLSFLNDLQGEKPETLSQWFLASQAEALNAYLEPIRHSPTLGQQQTAKLPHLRSRWDRN